MVRLVAARALAAEASAHILEECDLAEIERKEEALLLQLRAEANTANADFTRYAFRALAGSGIALSAIVEFMFFPPFSVFLGSQHAQGHSWIGLAAVIVLIFVLMVLRMGTYSATLSNRLLAYELHLARIRDIPQNMRGRWKSCYREISYEEAMRAWRIVQGSLYRAVCEPPNFFVPSRYKFRFRPSAKNPMWFNQESLFGKGSNASWNQDSYLSTMQTLLLLAAAIAALILLVTPKAILTSAEWNEQTRSLLAFAAAIAGIAGLIGVILSFRNEWARRILLADGIQSIHSYAISWQAVIVSHYSAIDRAQAAKLTSWQLADLSRQLSRAQMRDLRAGNIRFEELVKSMGVNADPAGIADGAGYSGYSFWLGQEAMSVERCARDIPGWIGLGEQKLRQLRRV